MESFGQFESFTNCDLNAEGRFSCRTDQEWRRRSIDILFVADQRQQNVIVETQRQRLHARRECDRPEFAGNFARQQCEEREAADIESAQHTEESQSVEE